jgi:hypothetical protein
MKHMFILSAWAIFTVSTAWADDIGYIENEERGSGHVSTNHPSPASQGLD